MIFAFEDDRTLTVLADAAAASREYEPIDVEEGSVLFFSDDGTALRPRFTKPNRRRFFGLVVDQGKFVLEPSLESGVADDIRAALGRAIAINPNPHFESLEAVREHVSARCRRAGGDVA